MATPQRQLKKTPTRHHDWNRQKIIINHHFSSKKHDYAVYHALSFHAVLIKRRVTSIVVVLYVTDPQTTRSGPWFGRQILARRPSMLGLRSRSFAMIKSTLMKRTCPTLYRTLRPVSRRPKRSYVLHHHCHLPLWAYSAGRHVILHFKIFHVLTTLFLRAI